MKQSCYLCEGDVGCYVTCRGWCAHGEVPLEGVLSVCGVEPGDLEGGVRVEREGEGLVDQTDTLSLVLLRGH